MAKRLGMIVLAGLLAYANSFSGPFIVDDGVSIVTNAQIRDLSNLAAVFAPQRESPTAGRPLVNLSFALNYAVGGLDVRGYHAVNLALHLICAVLLFALMRRTLALPRIGSLWAGRASDVALAVALLWVVHPLNSEVVDYLTQRTESVMALFFLLTLIAALYALGRNRTLWTIAAVAFCGLGMACKESMAVVPVIVVLFDRVFVFDSWKGAARRRWPLYAGLAACWGILALLLRSGPRMYSTGFSTRVSVWTYLLNQCEMITRYVRLTVWPRSLVLLYGEPRPLTLGMVFPPALLVALLLVVVLIALAKRPMVGFLGAWVFITLAPTSSFVPIATEVGAERRMYLPLMALIMLVVVGVSWAWQRAGIGRGAFAGTVTLLLLSAGLIAGTLDRNREYASPLSIATTSLERWPSGSGHFQVGLELAALDRHGEAAEEFRVAADTLPRARFYWAAELFGQEKLDDAIREDERAIRDEPQLSEVIPARLEIGKARQTQGNLPAAVAEFRRVLSMTPGNLDARLLLAGALEKQRAFEEAIGYYRIYLSSRPNDIAALAEFGVALGESERHDEEAVAVFRRVVAANPDDGAQRGNFARALLLHDEAGEAIGQAQAAVRLNPQDAAARDLLAQALAANRH